MGVRDVDQGSPLDPSASFPLEGNLIDLVTRALPHVGEIQVADVPGRCEPGTGEINYPAIARALKRLGYRGTVGLEAWPSGDDEVALRRFREAFTVRDER